MFIQLSNIRRDSIRTLRVLEGVRGTAAHTYRSPHGLMCTMAEIEAEDIRAAEHSARIASRDDVAGLSVATIPGFGIWLSASSTGFPGRQFAPGQIVKARRCPGPGQTKNLTLLSVARAKLRPS